MMFDTVCQHCGASYVRNDGYTDHSEKCPHYNKVTHAYYLGKRDGAIVERNYAKDVLLRERQADERTILALRSVENDLHKKLQQATSRAEEAENSLAAAKLRIEELERELSLGTQR